MEITASLGSDNIFVFEKENVELTITQPATDKTNPVTGYRIEARLYDFTVIAAGGNEAEGIFINVRYDENVYISKSFTSNDGDQTTFKPENSFFSGLSSDKIVKFFIYPQVDFKDKSKEDEEGQPISSGLYLGLHTINPQLELQQIVWKGNIPEATIAIKHPGFGYATTANDTIKSYRTALYATFKKIEFIGKTNNGKAKKTPVNFDETPVGWYNQPTMTLGLSLSEGEFSNAFSYQILITTVFRGNGKTWAYDSTLQSSYFLSALIANFVISHNGTAINIPKDFVPGLTSGLAVSTKANDGDSANSLALYDLFLDGTAYRNQPSISFRQIVKVSDGEGNLDKEVAKIYVKDGNLKIKIGNRTITFTATEEESETTI